jgi:hypothetical protein
MSSPWWQIKALVPMACEYGICRSFSTGIFHAEGDADARGEAGLDPSHAVSKMHSSCLTRGLPLACSLTRLDNLSRGVVVERSYTWSCWRALPQCPPGQRVALVKSSALRR